MRDLDTRVQAASWRPAATVPRPFVRHAHPEPSPGEVWQEGPADGIVRLSVVIPTVDAQRGGYFAKLLREISAQRCEAYEVIVVRGDPRQGRAINVGAALARGRYLLTLDDDTSLPDPDTFGKLIAVLEAHPEIGIAGGNNVVPEDAPAFVRRAMREIPRRSWEPVREITESDLAEHPCLMMRTAEFRALGGENELIPRGLDPYLRQRVREAGKRVVVVPGVIYHHLPPGSWGTLLRQCFRNGRQAAFVNRHYPQWVIETPAEHGVFTLQVPFWRRTLRYGGRLFRAGLAGQWTWLLCQVWYAAGFAAGWLRAASDARSCPCRRAEASPVRLGREGQALRCRQCGLLARDPLPSPEELRRWYATDYWGQFQAEQTGPERENIHAHVIEWLGELRPAKGLLVDVGCGGGALLRAGRAAGWKGIGFDPSAEAVAYARVQGLEVYELAWPPCPLADDQADAVTMVNVLDHLRDPFGALAEARRVLRKDGVLYIRVPNGPFHARLMRLSAWMGLSGFPVFHLYGFSRRAFLYHLPRLGFVPIAVRVALPAAGDPYGDGGSWAGWARRPVKAMIGAAVRVLRACGLDAVAWAPSLEIMAVKGSAADGQ
ncbi:methyltransferase domain-containing protein [Nitrospira sp. Kam-Ns4a]